jgi:hypothetical protein
MQAGEQLGTSRRSVRLVLPDSSVSKKKKMKRAAPKDDKRSQAVPTGTSKSPVAKKSVRMFSAAAEPERQLPASPQLTSLSDIASNALTSLQNNFLVGRVLPVVLAAALAARSMYQPRVAP